MHVREQNHQWAIGTNHADFENFPGWQAMKFYFLRLYDSLANSFWFIPAVMVALAGALAVGSVSIDRYMDDRILTDFGWIWSGSASGAQSVLSTVAGSVMTVVSIVFSITVTVLALMSSQFGPRILRNFTSDRGNQFTLGTFVATFIYCLLVLRTIRSVEESPFVPNFSVTIGVTLSLASMAVLIYFIHHITQDIQAERLISEVGREFQSLLPAIFPDRIDEGSDADPQNEVQSVQTLNWNEAIGILASSDGYIQRIDETKLMAIARERDLVLRLEKRPGDFVARDSLLLRALPSHRMDEGIEQNLRETFALGTNRTPHQDLKFPLQQLVEIALRALSPGINEPFTAINCIDWLGASLRSVITRAMPSPYRRDEQGALRVIARPYTFDELASLIFDQIRQYGVSNPDVALRLLEMIGDQAPYLHRQSDRHTLIHHVRLIANDAHQIANASDRTRVERCAQDTLDKLQPETM